METEIPVAHPDEHIAEATRNVAVGLALNWGSNWGPDTRMEIIGHLLKIANTLEKLGYK